jgi:methenyltetrahydrofolate cyclohydrolase
MSNSLREANIESFLDSLASETPTPGGGAVAALTGAHAAALISMVCHFSKNFKGAVQIDERARQARTSFLDLAQEDIEAFNSVMAALKSEKDVARRKHNIQSSLRRAAEAPRTMIKLASSLVGDALTLLQMGNSNLITDTGMIAILIEATIRSAELNILVNLKSIDDDSYRSEVTSEIMKYKAELKDLGRVTAEIRQSLQIG